MEREKEDERERTERKQRETGRGVKFFFIAYASLTSAYAYQYGLVVSAGTSGIKCGHKPAIFNTTYHSALEKYSTGTALEIPTYRTA